MAVDIVLQLVTFYFTQTSSANMAFQDYALKSINGPPSCQEDSWELIISVVTHAFCQTWLTVDLQESHSEQTQNPPSILVATLKGGVWKSSRQLQTVFLTQVAKDTPELVHYLVTLTALQQVNVTADHRRGTAQHDTGHYLNTTGLLWALSRDL